jgi:hypothetical protein
MISGEFTRIQREDEISIAEPWRSSGVVAADDSRTETKEKVIQR